MTSLCQVVSLEGSLTSSLRVCVRVPQGSILGQLLYIIFTNELPEVIHQEAFLTHHKEVVDEHRVPAVWLSCVKR